MLHSHFIALYNIVFLIHKAQKIRPSWLFQYDVIDCIFFRGF